MTNPRPDLDTLDLQGSSMRPDEPTGAQVRAIWQRMTALHGTRVIPKSRSWLMRAAGRALAWLGVLPYERFMTRYTTVWGRRIYPCFEPGQASTAQARFSHLIICAHEHQHVLQARRLGAVRMAAQYLLSSRRRALLEAEAYSCNVELTLWRTGQAPDVDALAAKLGDYACSTQDQLLAAEVLRQAIARFARGPLTEATAQVLASWDEVRQDQES